MIIGSLIFMVAGFIFLMLGRGSEPNVFQFLSIACSLVAGTLLIMGYLKERKRRPDKAEQEQVSAVSAGPAGSLEPAREIDVEADLKALEAGMDEEDLEPADVSSEPLVTSVKGRATAKRKKSKDSDEETQVLEPAMAGAAVGSMPGSEPPRSSGSGGGGQALPSSDSGPGDVVGKPFKASAGDAGPSGTTDSGSSGLEPSSANRQWASLISDVDDEKFEPPAFEKSKHKANRVEQESQTKEDPRKGTIDMKQPAATASMEQPGSKPEKKRKGPFGLFKRKSAESPAGPASGGEEETKGKWEPTASQGSAGTDMKTEPAGASPEAVTGELSAAQNEAAEEIGKESKDGGPQTGPETAPTGEHLEAVAANAGGGRGARAKTPAKRKTAAKPKTAAAKPRTTGKPKASAKPKTGPVKSKASGAAKTSAKPKAGAAAKPATGKTAKTTKTAKTAAKRKSPAKRKA